ncbi:hypothetical protein F0225_08205 [Vibrio pectenicida]|uniref:Uncharacterized protein n=1 Tax=Vibrio pectenicida TaxID=62763 RepID=A0A7Y4ED48_9VIBR|nr:hypothetical protein [Vibrio pectenicida]NOH71315.1 hypothetical protein [Vibrio pectenicida]
MESVLKRSNKYFSDTSDFIETHEDSKRTRVMAMDDVNNIISQKLFNHRLAILSGFWLPLHTLSHKLETIRDTQDPNIPALIPLGLKERGHFRTCDHIVLGIIQNGHMYVLDSKLNPLHNFDYSAKIKALSTGFQDISDRTNCGRYVVNTAIQLGQALDHNPNSDLNQLVETMQRPNLMKIQREYAKYMW